MNVAGFILLGLSLLTNQPSGAIRHTNAPPTSAIIGYIDPHTFFDAPAEPTNAPFGCYLEVTTNLSTTPWRPVTPDMYTVSNRNTIWVVYSSNFTTHVVTPIQTNTDGRILWNFYRPKAGVMYWRWVVLTNQMNYPTNTPIYFPNLN